MPVSQREVYIIPPPFNQELEPHPFIVLSCHEANSNENTFIAVMVTSSDLYKDDYSFDLQDEMFESPLPKKNSHVRMHLFTLCYDTEVLGNRINVMKPKYFKQLLKSIGEMIFEYRFEPLNI